MSQIFSTIHSKISTSKNWPVSGAFLLVGDGIAGEQAVSDYVDEVFSKQDPAQIDLLQAKTHPDYYVLSPLEAGAAIKIDQVRALIEWVQGTPQISLRKIAMISPAENLNVQAANALLKTLEEPPLDTLIILVTERPLLLLSTIRSRCRILRVGEVTQRQIPSHLTEEIKAGLWDLKHRKQDPLSLASAWHKKEIRSLLQGLFEAALEELKHSLIKGELKFENEQAWSWLTEVLEANRMIDNKVPLNTQLLLEGLFISYCNR